MAGWALRAGAVVGAVVLAGCDLGRVEFADLPTEVVLDRSLSSMAGLESATVASRVTIGGVRFRFDAAMDREGSCAGTLSIGSMAGKAEVRVVDGEGFVRGNATFWREVTEDVPPEALDRVADRWVRPPSEAEVVSVCDLDEILDRAALLVPAELDPDLVTRTVLPEYEGHEVVQVEAFPFAARVSTGADHYLLYVSGRDDRVDFSGFDEPVSVEAPPEDEVVDFSGVTGA